MVDSMLHTIHGPDTAPFSAYELLAYTNVVIDKLISISTFFLTSVSVICCTKRADLTHCVVIVVTSSHTYQLVAPKDQFGRAYRADRTP